MQKLTLAERQSITRFIAGELSDDVRFVGPSHIWSVADNAAYEEALLDAALKLSYWLGKPVDTFKVESVADAMIDLEHAETGDIAMWFEDSELNCEELVEHYGAELNFEIAQIVGFVE